MASKLYTESEVKGECAKAVVRAFKTYCDDPEFMAYLIKKVDADFGTNLKGLMSSSSDKKNKYAGMSIGDMIVNMFDDYFKPREVPVKGEKGKKVIKERNTTDKKGNPITKDTIYFKPDEKGDGTKGNIVTSGKGKLCAEFTKDDVTIRVCGERTADSVGKRDNTKIHPCAALRRVVESLLEEGYVCDANAYTITNGIDSNKDKIIPFSNDNKSTTSTKSSSSGKSTKKVSVKNNKSSSTKTPPPEDDEEEVPKPTKSAPAKPSAKPAPKSAPAKPSAPTKSVPKKVQQEQEEEKEEDDEEEKEEDDEEEEEDDEVSEGEYKKFVAACEKLDEDDEKNVANIKKHTTLNRNVITNILKNESKLKAKFGKKTPPKKSAA